MTSSCFSKEKFAETYKGNMMPLNASKMSVRTPFAKPLPPPSRRMPERPKTKRRKHVIEKDGEYKKLSWEKQSHLNLLNGGTYEGCLEDEVYHVLNEQQLDVEVLDEEVPEVEQVSPIPEQLSPMPQVAIVPETKDEGIADTPLSQRLLRTRRPLKRITLIQTGKKVVGKMVVGPGCSRLDPVSLE
ncbi:unnamed protein product [Lactuca saligna]|uniref:Uncharacterized protein n=1 Tax=Lactuca saligna TaxID=75948 RepID=A0AA35Y5F6_LACSI|nr:unnamed protein product [Lactuca saligna]